MTWREFVLGLYIYASAHLVYDCKRKWINVCHTCFSSIYLITLYM